MECDICCESFDHSIRKPYSLSSCPHTFCLKCLEEYSKECPECRRPINGKNINMALLKLIPESSYDQLKAITLKSCIEINEIKKSNEERLNTHESKLKSIKQTIIGENNKKINILKQNEKILSDECDIIFNDIKANLYLNKFEIDDQRKKIENNELNETELANLNRKLDEIKQNINNNSKHIEKKIIELQKVILNTYFDF
jgi:hypothetical protein